MRSPRDSRKKSYHGIIAHKLRIRLLHYVDDYLTIRPCHMKQFGGRRSINDKRFSWWTKKKPAGFGVAGVRPGIRVFDTREPTSGVKSTRSRSDSNVWTNDYNFVDERLSKAVVIESYSDAVLVQAPKMPNRRSMLQIQLINVPNVLHIPENTLQAV
ncbi:hypothetical protein K503DRAFT_782128 [Rhizopogon vinicolor AM-OR11-026]|uniref:Uncharacterized protein n=1 Tax=Rhizopogon vinicolor AM-OR11-026 TaxID=1314800 RepID=A0A1B7N3J9_9AGAM|nr:hypothetical protein K503DRAFT_782128 [Rhizopogon vinicolor AM-OR11-026]